MVRTLHTLLVVLAFVLVGLARAPQAFAKTPKVLVLTYQGIGKGVSPELQEQTTAVIAQEIEASGIKVTRNDDLPGASAASRTTRKSKSASRKDAPMGDPKAGKRAADLIERAKLAIEEQEFGPAIKQLKKAIRLLDENGDAVLELRLLSEAYLQLAVAYFQEGDEEEADDRLAKAVHFAPARKLEDTEYPPVFIRVFERARYYVLQRPRAKVEVRAKPGAAVLMDGRRLGKAPLIIDNVLPGAHWIHVEQPGGEVVVKKLLVRSKRTIKVEFEGAEQSAEAAPPQAAAEGVFEAIAANAIGQMHVAQMRKAGKKVGAQFVLFGGIYKTDTAYNIHSAFVRVSDGTVGRLADIAFDLDMLTAQIEVYKLAEDARNEATADELARIEKADTFALSTKIKARKRRRRAVTKREVRVATVSGAPRAPAPPKQPELERAPQNTVATARTPAKDPDAGRVVKNRPSLVPKDEVQDPPRRAKSSSNRGVTPNELTAVSARAPDDDDDDDGSMWWLWVVVGVAAAGAAGAGGYFALSSRAPDEGTLTVRW